jgi:hypothetical protein
MGYSIEAINAKLRGVRKDDVLLLMAIKKVFFLPLAQGTFFFFIFALCVYLCRPLSYFRKIFLWQYT